jgi:hypothetical protein
VNRVEGLLERWNREQAMKRTMTVAGAVAATLAFAATTGAQQLRVTNRSFVEATGKWKSDSESAKPEDPAAKVRIECDKNISLCAVAEGTNLTVADDGNLFTRLDVSPMHFTILHWDASGLIAQTTAKDCVKDRLVIDFRSKSVTMIQTPKGSSSDEDNEFCKVFTKTITSHLVRPTK